MDNKGLIRSDEDLNKMASKKKKKRKKRLVISLEIRSVKRRKYTKYAAVLWPVEQLAWN